MSLATDILNALDYADKTGYKVNRIYFSIPTLPLSDLKEMKSLGLKVQRQGNCLEISRDEKAI